MPSSPDRRRRVGWRLDAAVFLTLLVSFAWFGHNEPGWNVNSRLVLTLAWAETGKPQVERYVTRPGLETRDLAEYAGHLYSDKSIGTSLLGVPAAWVVTGIEFATDRTLSTPMRRYLITLLSVGICGAVAGVLLMHWLAALWWWHAGNSAERDEFGGRSIPSIRCGAAFLSLAVLLGSMLYLYGTLFMSYLPATMFLVGSLLILELTLARCERQSLTAPAGWLDRKAACLLFCAGLMAGLSILCEYVYGAAAGFAGLYLLWRVSGLRQRISAALLYGGGVILGVSPFLVYSITVFGHFGIPYQYHVMPEFRAAMARGFMGAIWPPKWDVLWLITFHPFRGIFFYSPLLLLGFAGLLWGTIRRPRRYAEEHGADELVCRRSACVLALVCAAFYVGFNACYYMWWGGWSFAPRHLAPAIPFLAAGLGLFLQWKGGRWLLCTAAIFGIVVHLLVNATEPQPPDGGWQVALLQPDLAKYDYPGVFSSSILPRLRAGQYDWALPNLINLDSGKAILLLVIFWCGSGVVIWKCACGRAQKKRPE